uniref:Uncharacterized protein n=1 Tax=uncultured Alphaproteobacteria bacterium TaxID=91750 RepID=A0A6G8F2U0_9PROT|nr:hypothetical protein PlAlph_5270 [uncultured Alphaproteobacteria bacterium]
MEIYLLAAMVLIYIVTSLVVKKSTLQRLWLVAFVVAFAVTAVALSFLRFTNQNVMMNAAELSWYYILYLFASIMVVLGIINLWLFRRPLWDVLFNRDTDNDDDDDI